jgi:hypothetical protein
LRNFDLRTAARHITSHAFGRSLLALTNAADLRAAAELSSLGFVGSASGPSADQTGITSTVDITGCSVTWTADASRRYRTMLYAHFSQVTNSGITALSITDAAGTLVKQSQQGQLANTEMSVVVFAIESGLSGSTTRKARAFSNASSLSIEGDVAGRRALIVVEDIGPV